MNKLLTVFIVFFSFIFNFSYSIKVSTISSDQNNKNEISVGNGENFIIKDIFSETINQYLWYGISFILMLVLIYGGYLLISSKGDEAEFKKANKMLIYGLIGIIVALSSYAIVKIFTGFF